MRRLVWVAIVVAACGKTEPAHDEPAIDAAAQLRRNQGIAQHNALAYRYAAREWFDNNPGATTCPTLVQLEQQPNSPHTLRDPWGSEYVVTCNALPSAHAVSPGPDKKLGTADDVDEAWGDPQH